MEDHTSSDNDLNGEAPEGIPRLHEENHTYPGINQNLGLQPDTREPFLQPEPNKINLPPNPSTMLNLPSILPNTQIPVSGLHPSQLPGQTTNLLNQQKLFNMNPNVMTSMASNPNVNFAGAAAAGLAAPNTANLGIPGNPAAGVLNPALSAYGLNSNPLMNLVPGMSNLLPAPGLPNAGLANLLANPFINPSANDILKNFPPPPIAHETPEKKKEKTKKEKKRKAKHDKHSDSETTGVVWREFFLFFNRIC